MSNVNSFGTRSTLSTGSGTVYMYSLLALEHRGFPGISRLPFSLRILLENLLRQEDNRFVKQADIEALAKWDVKSKTPREISFMPARVCSCRISPVCHASSIWRPCATASCGSGAIPTK